MQVDFYQLSRDPVDQVLPAIAARILGLGARLLAEGHAVAPERVEPAYLRDNVAQTIAEREALRAALG